jgi:hypothetical protein
MPLNYVCVYCYKKFVDEQNTSLLGSASTALGACDECRTKVAEGRLPPPFGQGYLCFPVLAAMCLVAFIFLLPIGDYRGHPDHWNMDLNAKISYLALLFPVGIAWSGVRRYGQYGLALIFCLMLAYPLLAKSCLGAGAELIDPRYHSRNPSTGAICLWISALSLGVGVWDIFTLPGKFGPQPVRYARTGSGFVKALLASLVFIYVGGLAAGYWRSGEWGLREQVHVGLWRTGLLGLPLAYLLWTAGSGIRSMMNEIAEQERSRKNLPPTP